jgi:hypothetical protein
MAPDKKAVPQPKSKTTIKAGDSEKISTATTYLMIGTALVFDAFSFVINFIPVAGQAIAFFSDPIGYLIFFLWFMIKGVKLMTKKRVAAMGGGLVISFIPILDALPEMTAAVAYTIFTTKTGLKK